MRPNEMEHLLQSIVNPCCMQVNAMPDANRRSRIARVLTAVHEGLHEQWTIQSLASVAGMSRSTFALHFNTLMGMPPMHYVTAWKVAQAKQMLQDQRLSVAKVAEMLGYSSEAAFRKAFKRIEGIGPGQARAAGRFNPRSESDARIAVAAP